MITEKIDTHYKQIKYEPFVLIEKFNFNFILGNILKYITRHKFKNKEKDIRRISEFYFPRLSINIPFTQFWDAKYTHKEVLDEVVVYCAVNEMGQTEKEILVLIFKFIQTMNLKDMKIVQTKLTNFLENYNQIMGE